MLDGWAEDDDDFKIRQRYQFTLRNDVQRHAIKMSVRVLDHEETIDGETSTVLTPADAQRYATRALNQFSSITTSSSRPVNSTSPAMAWGWSWVWTTTS